MNRGRLLNYKLWTQSASQSGHNTIFDVYYYRIEIPKMYFRKYITFGGKTNFIACTRNSFVLNSVYLFIHNYAFGRKTVLYTNVFHNDGPIISKRLRVTIVVSANRFIGQKTPMFLSCNRCLWKLTSIVFF